MRGQNTREKPAFVVASLTFALATVSALAKERAWKTGTVTEISSERFGLGNTGTLSVLLGQQHATNDKGVEYAIQSGDFSPVAAEMSMAHHRLKEQRVNLTESVEFALQGILTLNQKNH